MLRDIIRKEMLDTITSPKFIFTFLLCTILILLSVYTGINSYLSELKEYNASLISNEKNLKSQPSYQALAGLGIKISKPPQVLSTIISGIQAAVGRKIRLRLTPKLKFLADEGIRKGFEMSEKIKDLFS